MKQTLMIQWVVFVYLKNYIDMKAFIEKWLCKHKWTSHVKELYQRTTYRTRDDKEVGQSTFTREILICEKCGKIKTIEY